MNGGCCGAAFLLLASRQAAGEEGETGGKPRAGGYAIFDVVAKKAPKTLHDLAERGLTEELVTWLKEDKRNKIDINARDITGRTAVMVAADSGQVEILKKLISRGGQVGLTELHMNRSAIHFGARTGSIPILKTLIEAVANNDERLELVNQADKSGFTPVFIAKTNGHQEAFEYLLMMGARYNEAAKPVASSEGEGVQEGGAEAGADAPPAGEA